MKRENNWERPGLRRSIVAEVTIKTMIVLLLLGLIIYKLIPLFF